MNKNILILFAIAILIASCIPPHPSGQEEGSNESLVEAILKPEKKEKPFVVPDSLARVYAKDAGEQLKSKCVVFGRACDFRAEVLSTSTDKIDKKYIIMAKISWVGCTSNLHYWLQGKIVSDPDGNNAYWEKLSKSSNLPHCGNNCELNCLRY